MRLNGLNCVYIYAHLDYQSSEVQTTSFKLYIHYSTVGTVTGCRTKSIDNFSISIYPLA